MFNSNLSKPAYRSVYNVLITVVLFLMVVVFLVLRTSGHAIAASPDTTQVTGTVFRDFNTNGVIDGAELGVANITVKGYNAANQLMGSAITSATGTYTLDLAGSGAYRIEFTGIPNGLQPGVHGAQSASTIRFISDASSGNVDLGLSDPSEFEGGANPPVIFTTFQNGVAAGNSGLAIGAIAYQETGLNDEFENGTGNAPTLSAQIQDVGTVWGTAWQRDESRLFASTFLRRYAGMADGPGYVYVLDQVENDLTLTHKFDLQGVTPMNGGADIDLGAICRRSAFDGNPLSSCDPLGTGLAADYVLSASPATSSVDLDAFSKVGVTSYGGIDIQEGASILWLVNTHQKALISVDVSSGTAVLPGDVNQYPLATMAGMPDCSAGELRPWALKFADGRGYLGVVCDASTSKQHSDLYAYVLSFDPNAIEVGVTTELELNLDYNRDDVPNAQYDFHPWVSQWSEIPTYILNDSFISYPQPLLSDIDFDNDGNMYLNLFDRFGYQYGAKSYLPISGDTSTAQSGRTGGDILKVCNVASDWIVEGAEGCSVNFDGTRGPNGVGEYFDDTAGDSWPESSNGSFVFLKGSGQMMTTAFDPHPSDFYGSAYWDSQGLLTYGLANGEITNWYAAFMGNDQPYFGKSHGLGNLELLIGSPPLEIGNRVWCDADDDGIQDADESDIGAGIEVSLHCNSDMPVTVTTNANGIYLFTDAVYEAVNGVKIPRNAACTISVATVGVNGDAITNACGTYGVSPANQTTMNDGFDDMRDSDGIEGANLVAVSFNSGDSGENAHRYDFGFSAEQTTIHLSTQAIAQPSTVLWVAATILLSAMTTLQLGKKHEL